MRSFTFRDDDGYNRCVFTTSPRTMIAQKPTIPIPEIIKMQTQYITCSNCGSQNAATGGRCTNCGMSLPMPHMPMQPAGGSGGQIPGAEKKIAAGLCGILVGGLGVHKFILGYQQEGFIYLGMLGVGLILTFISCGILGFVLIIPGIMGLIEGIIYLTKSDEDFVNTYIINKKPWF